MHRGVSFRCTEHLRIAIRQKQSFPRFQHQVRSSNELIPKVTKPDVEEAQTAAFRIQDCDETLSKSTSKQQIATSDPKVDEKRKTGEELWKLFRGKYQNGNLTARDLVALFKGVYSEAQYQKFNEAPSSAYTISCCGIFPMCSIGLFSLVVGGAVPGLAYAQLTYTASILSFLGGITWGHTISQQKITFDKLGWAVAPPLLAWSAVMLPLPLGFAFTAAGLTASMIHDILLTSYPQWFKSLRYILTIIALISLLPTFFYNCT